MQELEQALEDMRALHQKVLGRPVPDLGPSSFIPFPPGVDPVRHVITEVDHLKKIAEQFSSLPTATAWMPPADSFVTKDEFLVRLEVPGVPKEELKVFVVDGECVVRGERKQLETKNDLRPLMLERPWGAFERRFVLPRGSQVDALKACARDGVLELRIPLTEQHVPEKQKVEVA
jgi:HSP20 family protein